MTTAANTTAPPVINAFGEITSINAAQYLTLRTANPIIAPDGMVPFACPGRDDLTDFLYEAESGSILLTLDPEGSMTSLRRWEADGQHATQTDQATVESGDWTEIDGGDMWEQLCVALRGTNSAQQAAIDKTGRLLGNREPDRVTREVVRGRSIVTAIWEPRAPKKAKFEMRVNEAGETLNVDWVPVARSK